MNRRSFFRAPLALALAPVAAFVKPPDPVTTINLAPGRHSLEGMSFHGPVVLAGELADKTLITRCVFTGCDGTMADRISVRR